MFNQKSIFVGILFLVIILFVWYVFVRVNSPRDELPAVSKGNAQISQPEPMDESKKKDDEKISTSQPIAEGIKKEDIILGKGVGVKDGDALTVDYIGALTDGRKFDSSYDRNEPFTFTLGAGQVIRGWDLGIQGMKLGGKRKLTIPPSLAYGEIAPPGSIIGPNETLIFEVSLLSIK